MDNPVYKLEKVIHSKEDIQDFEGPLDLILFLLGKNKMDIQEISVSLICDQYLQWLEARKQFDLDVASEFITMASHLVYLKTRMLLALEDRETQEEMNALIQSLEERRRASDYIRVKELAEILAPRSEYGRNIMTRPPEPDHSSKTFVYSHSKAELVLAMAEIRQRAERTAPLSKAAFAQIAHHEPYPVEKKTSFLLYKLKESGSMLFRFLFKGTKTRSEAVATFLAVLELCRSGQASLSEDGSEVSFCAGQIEESALPHDEKE